MDLKDYKKILGVWAHPDDEAFLSVGLMLRAQANGAEFACMTATKGERGFGPGSGYTMETIAQTREAEMTKCLGIYDCRDHSWMGFIDGELQNDNSNAIGQLIRKIETYNPDLVITFDKTGLTGHTDHTAVSHWVDSALEWTNRTIPVLYPIVCKDWYEQGGQEIDQRLHLYYNIDCPPLANDADCDCIINLTEEELAKKILALQTQKSQTAKLFQELNDDQIRKMLDRELFVLLS